MTRARRVRSVALVVVALLLSCAAYVGWHAPAAGQATPAARPSPSPAPTVPAPTVPAPTVPAPSVPTPAPPTASHAHTSADESRCAACHATLPDGRLRTRLADRRVLKPTGAWLGMAHDRDWIVRHRWVAADRGAVCAQCHKERDCTDCHDGRTRPPALHPNDWLTLHPQHARRSATDCQGCHALQTFCTECHGRLGISQLAPSGTRASVRVHPPASQWTGSVNQHGREARRSLSACVSCHAESDCVRCHAAGTPSAIRSPHPPGFRAQCRAALERNARACVTCHGPEVGQSSGACPP